MSNEQPNFTWESTYPHQLAAQFPRILEKIQLLWGSPQMDDYFTELLLDHRGNRQGFPKEVIAELFALYTLHGQEHSKKPNG